MSIQLPIYKLSVSDVESEGIDVNYVALVDKPAIEKNFLAFKDHEAKPLKFAIDDEEKRIVTGPAMVPDLPIYRREKDKEYYVVFDAQTIGQIAYLFFKRGYQANINIMHDQGNIVDESVFFESWVVDREKGKSPLKGFEDLPDGTWFLTAKINNDDAWEKIKSGEYRGFSVEGMFNYSLVAEVDPETALLKEIADLLEEME